MNQSRIILIGIALLIVVGFVFAFIFGRRQPPTTQIEGELLIWGVFDDSDVFQKSINDFRDTYSKVKIEYQKKSVDTYEKDLVNALAAGRGPDIFYVHNTWLLKHGDKLYPAPPELMTAKEFQDAFVDVAFEDFSKDGEVYAMPLYVDTLALFYNKDIFNSASIANPPTTWEGVVGTIPFLIKKDEAGNISRSAIAMGTAKNVNRATDILSLIMLQSGVKMFDAEGNRATFDRDFSENGVDWPSGQQALEFYTNFARTSKNSYTWNGQMPYSIDAFLEGRAAMMLNYHYQIANIRAKSPHLKFAISFAPQPKNAKQKVNYANYWGLGVSNSSQNKDLAWIIVKDFTDKLQSQEYLTRANHPTARRDLVDLQKANGELGVFAQQSLSAYSWKQPDNVAVEKIFEEMIDLTVAGISAESAINNAADKINLLREDL